MSQLILFSPISMVLAYRYFSFLITRTKVKALIVMSSLMQLTKARNQLHFQLNTRNQVKFIVLQIARLCRFNYEDLFECPKVNLAKTEEHHWLQQFASSLDSTKSWAQYHIQEKCTQPPIVKDTNSLLPLLRDKVNALDIQVHTINLNIKSISAWRPSWKPVDSSDCLVYALTKDAQFRFPEYLLNYSAMFVGLHVVKCLLVTNRQFIEGSGNSRGMFISNNRSRRCGFR